MGGAISGPAGVPEFQARPAAVGFLRSDGAMTQVLTQHATEEVSLTDETLDRDGWDRRWEQALREHPDKVASTWPGP